jgi:hypothetical protein
MEAAYTFVGQEPRIIENEAIRNPVVDLEHARYGAYKQINAGADNCHEHTLVLETLDRFSRTRHQFDTGVGPEQLVLVDGCSNGLPHLDVGPHELNV